MDRWRKYETLSSGNTLPWVTKIKEESSQRYEAYFWKSVAFPVVLHHLTKSKPPAITSLSIRDDPSVMAVKNAVQCFEILWNCLAQNTASEPEFFETRTSSYAKKTAQQWKEFLAWLVFLTETYLKLDYEAAPWNLPPSEVYLTAIKAWRSFCFDDTMASCIATTPGCFERLMDLWLRGPVFAAEDHRQIRVALQNAVSTTPYGGDMESRAITISKGKEARVADLLLWCIQDSARLLNDRSHPPDFMYFKTDITILQMLTIENASALPLHSLLLRRGILGLVCDVFNGPLTSSAPANRLSLDYGHQLAAVMMTSIHFKTLFTFRGKPYLLQALEKRLLQSTIQASSVIQDPTPSGGADRRNHDSLTSNIALMLNHTIRRHLHFYSVLRQLRRELKRIARDLKMSNLLQSASSSFKKEWRRFVDAVEAELAVKADYDRIRNICSYRECDQVTRGGRAATCIPCRSEQYCSIACQRLHWPEHKPVCMLLRRNVASGYELGPEMLSEQEYRYIVWKLKQDLSRPEQNYLFQQQQRGISWGEEIEDLFSILVDIRFYPFEYSVMIRADMLKACGKISSDSIPYDPRRTVLVGMVFITGAMDRPMTGLFDMDRPRLEATTQR